jgi:hypothetical protein
MMGVFLAAAMFVFVIDTSFMHVSISAAVNDLDRTVSGVQSAVAIEALVSASFILISSKLRRSSAMGGMFSRAWTAALSNEREAMTEELREALEPFEVNGSYEFPGLALCVLAS